MYFASYFSFFKQMTEYDMCIRDWSSDVCSSDLGPREPLIMRGLFFAVVDEADSIFIDEARTPLILSAELPADDDGLYLAALELVRQLEEGRHYRIREADRAVELTERGCRVVADLSEGLPQIRWRIQIGRAHV